MSQKDNLFYSLLSNVYIYNFFQKIMSATRVREEFVKKHIKKEFNVIDVGSGPSSILRRLPKINYYGFDIDPFYINYAKIKYPKKNFNFFCEKLTKKKIFKLPKFDCALLLGIVHHLNDVEFKKILNLIKIRLKKRGKILILDSVLTKKQNFISRFLIKKDRGDNIRKLKDFKFILNKYFKKINYKIDHQKFIPYTWLKIVCYK